MKLESLRDIDKLMGLCRKNGVSTFKIDNIEFRLEDVQGPEAKTPKSKARLLTTDVGINEDTKIDTPNMLTDEELMFYSATGQPTESMAE